MYYHISIPCGAIRRRAFSETQLLDAVFQFLVVRLEEQKSLDSISNLLFQFLVVRLEVPFLAGVGAASVFQFLVVRLDETTKILRDFLIHFNSLWCD